jgi:hypothetical protein
VDYFQKLGFHQGMKEYSSLKVVLEAGGSKLDDTCHPWEGGGLSSVQVGKLWDPISTNSWNWYYVPAIPEIARGIK